MRGGGTLLLINPRLLPRGSAISKPISPSNAYNISAASVMLGDKKTFIIAVYRPPWGSHEDLKSLICDLNTLIRHSLPVVLVGDFNLPKINWFNRSLTPEDGLHNIFQDFTDQAGLSQLSFSTRGDASLDLVLVSDNICALNCHQLPPIAGSDHLTQFLRIESSQIMCISTSVCNGIDLSRIDISRTNQLLCNINWNTVLSSTTNVDQMLSIFMNILWDIFNMTAPLKQRFKRHPQRFPRSILKLIWKKRKAWKLYVKTGRRMPYTLACRKVKWSIRQFYAEQENNLLKRNDKKSFFRYVNKRLGRSQQLPSCFKTKSGMTLGSENEIANAFNSEFVHNFGETVISCCPKGDENGLMLTCTIEDVRKYLLMTSNSAAGPDGISGCLLKNISLAISYPLWLIFQQSFMQATFPALWKEAIIQPIYKNKGDKEALDSYRPVSLCSVIGKTLERIVKDQLMEHIKRVCPLNSKQHGFCEQKSTLTNLLAFDNYISNWENNSMPYTTFLQ